MSRRRKGVARAQLRDGSRLELPESELPEPLDAAERRKRRRDLEDEQLEAAQKVAADRRRDLEAAQLKTTQDLYADHGRPLEAVAPARFGIPRSVARGIGPVEIPTETPRRPGQALTALGQRFLAEGLPALLYPMPPPSDTADRIEQRVRSVVPAAFHGITWQTLGSLRNADELPSLGAVETLEGRRLRGAEAVWELRERLRDKPKAVLVSDDTRVGKTISAIAALDAAIRRGAGGACFAPAARLKDPELLERALRSPFVVLDNLGYELNGAQEGSGWLPGLAGPACEFLDRWYMDAGPGRRLVVTTFLDFAQMAPLYGAGAAARVYEGAAVIRLHRE